MFLARRNAGCFSLLKETLPKGHFNLSLRGNLVAQGRGCSIWKEAWAELGWFLATFMLLLPWTDSPSQPCDLLAGHRAWSLHSLQRVLMLSGLRTLWLAAPLAPGLAFQLPSSPVWQGRGCQETGRMPSCRRKATPKDPHLPEGTAAPGLLYLPGLRCCWLDLMHWCFIIISPFTKYLYTSLNFQCWDHNVLSHVYLVE